MIKKYLDAFTDTRTVFKDEVGKLFFLRNSDDSKNLHILNFKNSLSYRDSTLVCNEDFSKRSFDIISFDSKESLLYLISDDDNKENYNIYTLNILTKEFIQVTHTSYCGVYGLSLDFKKLVYGDRYKTENGNFFTRLYVRDLEDGSEELLLDDEDWDYRLSWSSVIFDEKNENIFLMVNFQNMRKKSNLLKINLETKKIDKLIATNSECSSIYCLSKAIINDELYYCSNESGFYNLQKINVKTKESYAITNLKTDHHGIKISKDNKFAFIAIFNEKKNITDITKIDLCDNNKSISNSLEGPCYLADSEGLWISCSSIDSPNIWSEYTFEQSLSYIHSLKSFSGELNELVHNTYRYVEYESFDGEIVSAYLSLPKKEIRGAVITTFYGGVNYYSWASQVFSELGIVHLSPSVRGSYNKGNRWRDLIKGDLGGDEIIDVHYGAKFLEKELGLTPSQIGVEGGSHGGYSVLRAMTMPEGFKRIKESFYPYGFGICWAGFADLEDFYKTSNIPDWLVDMLGPYEGNEEKYRERSPLNFFDNLDAPLFISHGENDSRVSPSSMSGFLSKLDSSDKDYILHMEEELGHSGGNNNQQIILYNKLIAFINRVVS